MLGHPNPITGVTSQDRAPRAARWYVLQVERGRERTEAERLTRILPTSALAEPLFSPTFETETKVRGRWVKTTKDLLKGYLIAVSADPELLAGAVEKTTGFVRVLSTQAGPAPLTREEAALFGGLGEPGRRCLPMSRGYRFEDGSFAVFEGPLAGNEGLIESVDRRHSTANLLVSVGGTPVRARAGLALLPVPDNVDPRALQRRTLRQAARRPLGTAAA